MKNKTEARKPLIGYMIIEDYTDDYSDWSGQITFPDPTGANIAWQNPIKMIEASHADQREAEFLEIIKLLAAELKRFGNMSVFEFKNEFVEYHSYNPFVTDSISSSRAQNTIATANEKLQKLGVKI